MPEKLSKNILIIGYGNPDRQDDGVAWHILTDLAGRLNRPVPDDYQEGFPESDENPALLFDLQLIPEHAEIVSKADVAIFIDAHTGGIPEDLQVRTLSPHFQNSPFTHHFTPESCLSLAETISGKAPAAFLVTVRGFEFGFSRELSPGTLPLAREAADRINQIIKEYE
jgi:hydrogenase maturation protease